MTRSMSTEDRAEYDELMYAAGLDGVGKPLPSHEIGERVRDALNTAADQSHRQWARLLLDDIERAGALARWKHWYRRREVIEVGEGDAKLTVVTTKAAAMAVRKSEADGRSYYQTTFWEDMTRDELAQIITGSSKRVVAEQRSIMVARRLLTLLDRVPAAKTAGEAASALAIDLASYLAEPESVAS